MTMIRVFRGAVASLIVAVGFAGSVLAGPLEDGFAAYERADYATAMGLWRRLADQGDADAQFNLGVLYEKGQGVRQDYAAAASWYRKAADQGETSAESALAKMYFNGQGVPKDHAAAMSWVRKAADQGDVSGQVELGANAFASGDYVTAMRLLRPLADRGFVRPQFYLGLMYANGRGVPRNDAAAVSWYRKAAEQRYGSAQINLGFMYENARGVPQDYTAAMNWYRKAADSSWDTAQNNLGLMYANGRGVPQDYVMAHMWFNLATANGNRNAASNRDLVAARMTPTQIGEAQKRAAEWQAKREAERQAAIADAAPTPPAPRPEQIDGAWGAPASKKPNSEAISGTAFFVSKEGKVLTNAHVVQECRQISVNTEGHSSAAEILAKDERNDLALLATGLRPARAVNWRLQVRQGEDIIVYGFPLTGVLASGGNVATGIVTALAGLADDSRFLQISAPVQPGNSGGPLLDRNGAVVGIVVAKLNALRVAAAIGDIPQNVNFAIKASVASAFLDAQRLLRGEAFDGPRQAHSESAGAVTLSTPDIAERAKSFTVQVICVR
jgi:TPR repeat protein